MLEERASWCFVECVTTFENPMSIARCIFAERRGFMCGMSVIVCQVVEF